MTPDIDSSQSGPLKNPQFTTTQWSIVLAAGYPDSPAAHQALERLCQTYWYPIYAYVRRRGHSPHDAEDLTQGFFARLLKRNDFASVRRDRGKFRTFLLVSARHFLSEQRRHDAAQKRGAGEANISLEAQTAEQRYRFEPVDSMTPEKLYDRRWAFTLLDRANAILAEEYNANGKAELYKLLKSSESGACDSLSYAEIGRRLEKTESAIKAAASRLRERHRDVLREEIAQTVATVLDIDEELRYLAEIVSS